jgi:hypothetical protein
MGKELWASLLYNCKPSHATARDETRPVLRYGWIEHDDDGAWLTATDSYILARVPIRLEGWPEAREDRLALLPEVLIPREAMQALDDAGRFRIEGKTLQIEGKKVLYELGDESLHPKRPNGGALVRDNLDCRKPQKLQSILFDPDLLKRVSLAIGAMGSVELEFRGARKAIKVWSPIAPAAVGLLMPKKAADE